MSQTALTVTKPLGPYVASVAAEALKVTMQAADASNGNSFPLTGKEILLIQNTDTVAHTVTISSVPDAEGRSGDITSYSVPAGEIHAFSFRGGTQGWQQTDGTVHLAVSSALIFFGVLQPAT
jgi:hypothetical protein